MGRISVQTMQVSEASAGLSISTGGLKPVRFTSSNLSPGNYHSIVFACS